MDKPLDSNAMPDVVMHLLLPHPDTPESAVNSMSVAAVRDGARLWLRFVVEGNMDAIQWPAPAASVFTDGLWQYTCFEVFLSGGQGASYVEGNFSPSSQYAFYAFDGYRDGMRALRHAPEPSIGLDRGKGRFALEVEFDFAALAPELAIADWTLGLSAVIENADGGKSYHALAHPGGAPDFHHAACFALEMKA